MLCSDPGSTRASTDVWSQIEATPGAVIAAQAVPDDCGRLPPLASFSESCSDVVAVPWRATVMSAPMRVSQNGEIDCLTDTAEVPFALSLADHAVSMLPAAFDAPLPLGAGPVRVEASTLSRLQSSLLTSMSFMMSTSLAPAAASVSSAAGSSVSSSAGGVCAAAATIEAKPMQAASIGSRAQPNRILGIIARPHSKSRPECVRSVAKLWRE